MKVTILNDTCGKHFGCELVMQTYRDQLERVGIEVVNTVPMKTRNIVIPKEADLVIVNGEGSLHRGQHKQLIDIAAKYPAILLNSIWQDNPQYSALYKFKYISVRESFSYKQLPPNLTNVEIVPDISFTSKFLNSFQKPASVFDMGATDNVTEKGKGDGFSALQPANEFIPQLCQYNKLCIGRFHAVVAAAVLQIPFSVWQSNSHKMIGMLTDMGVPQLHFNNKVQAMANVPVEFDERIAEYVVGAQQKIDRMFENIHNLT